MNEERIKQIEENQKKIIRHQAFGFLVIGGLIVFIWMRVRKHISAEEAKLDIDSGAVTQPQPPDTGGEGGGGE